jgi:hypothetical protein
METLRIELPFEKQGFINAQYIRWEIHWLKNKKQLIEYSIGSLVILAFGLLARSDKEIMNPFIVIGLALLLLTFFFVYIRQYSKRTFKRKITDIAERFDTIKMDCTYEFSDESIKYWDKEKNLEFNWSVFTYYSIYKGYLILILNNSLVESYLFEKKELKIEEYEKVFEFVKTKLDYKEIK